jgi:hypothetical protein
MNTDYIMEKFSGILLKELSWLAGVVLVFMHYS